VVKAEQVAITLQMEATAEEVHILFLVVAAEAIIVQEELEPSVLVVEEVQILEPQ
jgi:hypothetical protein